MWERNAQSLGNTEILNRTAVGSPQSSLLCDSQRQGEGGCRFSHYIIRMWDGVGSTVCWFQGLPDAPSHPHQPRPALGMASVSTPSLAFHHSGCGHGGGSSIIIIIFIIAMITTIY